MPDRPPSDDERRLLEAIVADPENDAPRLAYADWISDRDPERAEFIRLSIELERGTTKANWNDPIRGWHYDLKTWFTRPVRDLGATEASFERGFVVYVALPSDLPFERAAALFEANPLLRAVCIQAESSHTESLAALPHLSRLRGLRVCLRDRHGKIDDGRLADLVASPHLTSVKGLSFDGVSVGPRTARAIAESAAFETLTGLSISGTVVFNSAAARALAEQPRFGNHLRSLEITNCNIKAEGCAAIANSHLLAGVTSLTFEGSWIGDEGAQALARAPLEACTKLGLKQTGIGDAGAVALANSPVFESLEELDLFQNHIGDEGAKAFAATPYLPLLRRLDLKYNSIREEGTKVLAGTDRLPSLEVLGISNNAIYTDEIEEWTDWDGTPVGSGPVPLPFHAIKSLYERRFKLD